MIEVRYYRTKDGREPFTDWLDSLTDQRGIKQIAQRVRRLRAGNLGDYKGSEGILELRFKSKGPGYRIYCGMDGQTLIILLCGGDKSSQKKDFKKAKEYWDDHNS